MHLSCHTLMCQYECVCVGCILIVRICSSQTGNCLLPHVIWLILLPLVLLLLLLVVSSLTSSFCELLQQSSIAIELMANEKVSAASLRFMCHWMLHSHLCASMCMCTYVAEYVSMMECTLRRLPSDASIQACSCPILSIAGKQVAAVRSRCCHKADANYLW